MVDYANYEFDLKKEQGFYYVTLRNIEDDDEFDNNQTTGPDTPEISATSNIPLVEKRDSAKSTGFYPISAESESANSAEDKNLDDNDQEVASYFPLTPRTKSPPDSPQNPSVCSHRGSTQKPVPTLANL